MPEFRNISNDTVRVPVLNNKSIEPDEVVDIPDSLAHFFEDHPVLKEVGVYVPPAAAPVVSPDPVVSPTPVAPVPHAPDVEAQ
jgi:hypothetical protein